MQVQLYGITKDDIQRIFEEVVNKYKRIPKWIYLDASYLYNWHLDDFDIVRKHCLLTRYDLKAVLQWHQWLERWLADQSVTIAGERIKPIGVVRSFDRVVNEAMESVAKHFIGTMDSGAFKFHALGTGSVSEITPNDQALVNQISRIDVTTELNGGTLTRDGSTLYIIGNHPKSVAQGDITETGVFDSLNTASDKMLDHSIFPTPIPHLINQDVPGATTIIWQCSS